MNYYGLNRQGMAASNRATRTPTPMPWHGQSGSVRTPTPMPRYGQSGSVIEPSNEPTTANVFEKQTSISGKGDGGRLSKTATYSGYSSPEAQAAAGDYMDDGLYDPAGSFVGLGKKMGVKGLLGLGLGLRPSAAIDLGLSAATPAAIGVAALKAADESIGLNRAAAKAAPGYQRAEEAALMQDRQYEDPEAKKLGVRFGSYTPTYQDRFKSVLGGQDMSVSDIGTGTPGSTPGDFGHEARMGMGLPGGETSNPGIVGSDYGAVDGPKGYAEEGEGEAGGNDGRGNAGGGYGDGVGGQGQSAGYK